MPPDDLSPPILFLDVDGVISLFGFPTDAEPPGAFHNVEGIIHCLSAEAGTHLRLLEKRFELVWATGWEERANEHLPRLLGLSTPVLPMLSFDGRAVWGTAHWKVAAIDEYARDRPVAWIDDNLDERCKQWALDRDAPTLLVPTEPAVGITDRQVDRLVRFADSVADAAERA
jgi:hypothetical protein